MGLATEQQTKSLEAEALSLRLRIMTFQAVLPQKSPTTSGRVGQVLNTSSETPNLSTEFAQELDTSIQSANAVHYLEYSRDLHFMTSKIETLVKNLHRGNNYGPGLVKILLQIKKLEENLKVIAANSNLA